jgi:hypothetical protein
MGGQGGKRKLLTMERDRMDVSFPDFLLILLLLNLLLLIFVDGRI